MKRSLSENGADFLDGVAVACDGGCNHSSAFALVASQRREAHIYYLQLSPRHYMLPRGQQSWYAHALAEDS